MQNHSLMQAAALLGVHKSTLQNWLADGCPAVERGDRERGLQWKINLGEVMQWRTDRAVANAVAPFNGTAGDISKEEADRRRAVAVARMSEIDLDAKLLQVVHRDDVEEDFATYCRLIRQMGDNAFDKIAARCATMTSPHEIHAMCSAEWNKAHTFAQEELDRLWGLTKKGNHEGSNQAG